LAAGVLAVDPGLPSRTSIPTASLRAVGAKNPDAALRNPVYTVMGVAIPTILFRRVLTYECVGACSTLE
jgi:hypothetical protein